MCYVPSPKDLSSEQSYRIESIQKRAVKIIYGHYCTDYETTCSQLNICLLENHRSDLCKSFFRKSVMDPKSCLHYLLPEPRGDFVDKLREDRCLWSLQLQKQTVAIIPFYTMLLIIIVCSVIVCVLSVFLCY